MITFIDTDCRLGRGPADPEESVTWKAALLEIMDRFNVEKAVVHGSVAKYSDPIYGNELLTAETEGCGRLLRQWAVLPPLRDLSPSPEEWARKLKEANVCSVRLFPAQFGHSLRRYAAGGLFDMLAECRLPAFIGLDQLPDWDALYTLCSEYPEVKFVLCSPGYRCLRYLVPIMVSCKNLLCGTSNLFMHDGFPYLCANGYTDRLLFGSGMPEGSLAAAASQLCLSDISEEEKQLIARGNAEKLFEEVTL